MKERFTVNQLKYSAAMKSLIELYYAFRAIEGNSWQTLDVENALRAFFNNLFGYCCTIDRNGGFRFGLYRGASAKGDISGSSSRDIGPERSDYNTGIAPKRSFMRDVWVGKDELNTLKDLMDALYQAIEEKTTYHFIIAGFRDEIDTEFTDSKMDALMEAIEAGAIDQGVKADLIDDKQAALKEKEYYDSPPVNDPLSIPHLINEVERVVLDSLRSGIPSQEIIGDVHVRTDPYRIIMASPASRFGKEVIYAVPQEDHLLEIPHIYSASCHRFIQIIRSLYIIYQIEFGSYDRIKLCAYCKKMFLEKKKGAAVFCNGRCRKKDYDDRQPLEKKLCRERQNAWIRNRFLGRPVQAYYAGKHECLNCGSPVKSGECPVILEKNKDKLIY